MTGAGSTEVTDVSGLLAARRAAQDADTDRLGAELLTLATAGPDRWERHGTSIADTVRALSPASRTALAKGLVEAYHSLGDDAPTRPAVLTLLGIVARGLPQGQLSTQRLTALDALGRQHLVRDTGQLRTLVEEELAAGRHPAPSVVALVRRTALQPYWGTKLSPLAERLTRPVISPGDAWADRALAELAELPKEYAELLAHAATATAARPAAAWDARARAVIKAIGADPVRETVLGWLTLVGRPRTSPFPQEASWTDVDTNHTYDPFNANALRGLAWTLSLLPPRPETSRALGTLLETSLRKVPGLGPRNPKVANACVLALARVEGEAALAELARLATRVTYKGTRKILDAALESQARAMGLRREEVEELAVPAYGLTEVGRAVLELGDTTAELRVEGGKALLTWRNAAGKQVKSVPAAVRRDHAEELTELKAAVKDIDKMLSAQSERLDRQFLAQRGWRFDVWRQRYLDHPLVGTLARRLLWTVDGVVCGFADGELRTLADVPVSDGTEVGLWHPIAAGAAEVVAWREWLERHRITQPFKQAHREVYPLTDAERRTGTYSNRFAAHILRQHQFHSLAALRGWTDRLRLAVDDSVPPPTRELPGWGLRAEYWVCGEHDRAHGPELTGSGSFLRLRTDQVRFYPIDAPVNYASAYGGMDYRMWAGPDENETPPLALTEIPALVFSEILRDVDLFVGVASVGNDPGWQDGGPEGRYREYWTSYGFGELGQSAETRRDLLTRLLPRLAIGGQCSVEGRFLHVRGDRHTYRIHLGSGNILISPNDRYLCIVPTTATAAGTGTGYLPFEGDRTLAVILSKAMMLARDKEITDPSILSQL